MFPLMSKHLYKMWIDAEILQMLVFSTMKTKALKPCLS